MIFPKLDLASNVLILSGCDRLQNFHVLVDLLFICEEFALLCFNPKSVVIGSRECFRTKSSKISDALLVSQINCFLVIGSLFLLLLLCLFNRRGCVFLSLNGIFLGFGGSNLSLLMLLLLPLLLFLDLAELLLDSGVVIVGELDETENSGALRFDVFCSLPLVLLLHVASLIAILSFVSVILVILRELSPTLEVVPELVELLDVGEGHVDRAKVWRGLLFGPSRV